MLFAFECGTKMMTQFVIDNGGIMGQFIKAGKVNDVMTNSGISKVKDDDKSLYRVESIYEGSSNYSLVNDVPTVSSYYSITSGNISETMESLENSDIFTAVWTKDLSRRTGLMELAGVKYYLKRGSGIDLTSVPYGYKLKDTLETKAEDENNDNVYLYENSLALPLVYGYDNYMKKSDWDSLDSYDKENAMLQIAVVQDDMNGELKERTPSCNSVVVVNKKKFMSKLKKMKLPNMKVKGDKITVKSGMVKIPISFKGIANSETHLNIKGIDYNHFSDEYVKEKLKASDISQDERSDVIYNKRVDNFYLGGIINDKYAGFNYCTKYYIYNGAKSTLCNYGYNKNSLKEAYFYMSSPGVYTFDDIKIVCQPMDNYKKYVKKLKLNIKNLEIEHNKISYNAKLNNKKLICTAVPYSKGWSAKIDGKSAKIIKTNGMYMGVVAPKGNHKIEYSYVTPGLGLGSALSLAGWLVTISLFIIFRRKKNTN